MTSLNFLSWIITIIDFWVAMVIFMSALVSRVLTLSVIYKIGFIMTGFGISAQAGLNLEYLIFGYTLQEQTIPLWVRLLKDVGIAIVVIYFYFTRVTVHGRKASQ